MPNDMPLTDIVTSPVAASASGKLVRSFDQVVVWPLQLERDRDRAGSGLALESVLAGSPWQLVDDEMGDAPIEERHYREFVSFLPPVQRFLYGDVAGRIAGLSHADVPMRIWRRTDVASVRVVLAPDEAPITCTVTHVDLHFFHEVDVVILACEISASDLRLTVAQELMYRFGRAYPPGWSADGQPLHCPELVEWLDANGNVLAASDYENRSRYVRHVGEKRAPCFSAHWEYLLSPLASHGSEHKGTLGFRQVEYYRMPQTCFLAFDRLADLSRTDTVRIAFASGPSKDADTPYSEGFLADFERRHCYDRFYHERPNGQGVNTRFLLSGHALTVLAEGPADRITDNERGLLGQFRHQYFLLFLIAHFHKAALLMLSDRLVAAVKRLEVRSHRSAAAFRREIYRLHESFMRFTQRYWFTDVSDQAQARDLFRMLRSQLAAEEYYRDLRSEIFDTVQYLDSDILRRQTGSMHRLTAVTILGLIGTVATGFLGMNLIAEADQPLTTKIAYFGGVLGVVAVLTIAIVLASRPLTDLFDQLSGDK
ncbi:MAG: hypothetical protein U1E49_12065 [Hyphomicrobiaceae bacterium]